MPFSLCTFYFLKIRNLERDRFADAYYFGVIFIYIQTNFNPYINNPIGLSYVIISVFALRTIYLSKKMPADVHRPKVPCEVNDAEVLIRG